MTLYEILYEMKKLCITYDIDFMIMRHGIIIKKYFDYNGSLHGFNQVFPFDFLRNYDLEDMVLEFERRLELEMEKIRLKEREE